MAVNLSPLGVKPQFELSTGLPAVGGLLFFYAAGSVGTKQNTYTDSTGGVANTNPIVLDALGMPTNTQIWFTSGLSYKVVYAPVGDTDPPSSPIWTVDNVSGISSPTSVDQWIASGLTPTFVNSTTFTLVGDQTSAFHIGRRLKTTITAGTGYHTIVNSAFAAVTTVTVTGTALDSGLSAVSYGILTATNTSMPGMPAGTDSAPGWPVTTDNNTGLFSPGPDILGESTGGVERRRTTLAGYSKFSNSGTYNNATGQYHEMRNSTASEPITIFSHPHATLPLGIHVTFTGGAPDNNTQYFARFGDTVADRCFIDSDGDLRNHDNSYGAISDERVKTGPTDEDAAPVPSGSQTEDFMALQVVKYRDRGDVLHKGSAAKVMLGLNAQQVETISPGLVTEHDETEFYEEQAFDSETGAPLIGVRERKERPTGRKIKSVQYSIYYMKGMKALQETIEELHVLRAEFSDYKAAHP